VLSSPKRAREITTMLREDGAWTQRDVDLYVNPKTEEISDTGKRAIEQALVGQVLQDPSVIGNAPKGVTKHVFASLAPMVRLASHKEYGKRFVQVMQDVAASYAGYKDSGLPVEQYYFEQGALFDFPGKSDTLVALTAKAMDVKGVRQFRGAMNNIAKAVGIDDGGAQATLFDTVTPAASLDEAVANEFGSLNTKATETAAQAAQRAAEEARTTTQTFGTFGGGVSTAERIRDDEIPDAIKAPEEQERRLQKAKGMRKPSLMRRIKETLAHLKNVTRAQEHIPNTEEFASANEFFRLLRNVPTTAQDDARMNTQAIVDPLGGPKQLLLFERATIMDNLAASLEAGQPLRFGFKSREEVDEYRAQLQEVVGRAPAVQQAIETRRKIVKETTDKLVEYDLLPEEAKENTDTYYHQQVHYYMVAHGMKGGGTRAGKVGRSFQQRRVVGEELAEEEMDYNTSYLEAEISWLTDAYMEIEKERLLRQLMDTYDSKPQLKDRAKRQNFENVVGGPKVAARIDQILGELAESRASEDAQDSAERMRRKQLIEELEKIDPTHPYRQQIAKMAGWFRKEHGIDEDYEDWYGEVDDNQFWKMVKQEADKGDVPALAFFKALHEREQFIRDTLGKDYATWETLAEQAYGVEVFQPEPGNQFYRAFTVPERIVEQLQGNVIESAELIGGNPQGRGPAWSGSGCRRGDAVVESLHAPEPKAGDRLQPAKPDWRH
jgi:hypothetical protein